MSYVIFQVLLNSMTSMTAGHPVPLIKRSSISSLTSSSDSCSVNFCSICFFSSHSLPAICLNITQQIHYGIIYHEIIIHYHYCLHAATHNTDRVPTLYEELHSLTFPDHARNFSLTKLTCNSYFSLHFRRLLLPYTDSVCYHYHILNQ